MCDRCGSMRLMNIIGKVSDRCIVKYPNGEDQIGYVPTRFGIGGSDYIEFTFCMDCGKIQGSFPVAPDVHENSIEN